MTAKLVRAYDEKALALMSASGQKQTSPYVRVMSALPPKADIDGRDQNVRFVPKAEQTDRVN